MVWCPYGVIPLNRARNKNSQINDIDDVNQGSKVPDKFSLKMPPMGGNKPALNMPSLAEAPEHDDPLDGGMNAPRGGTGGYM